MGFGTPRTSAGAPAWTFTGGVIGNGLFTTNNAAIDSTTQIVISGHAIDGGIGWDTFMANGSISGFMVIGSGGASFFQISAGNADAGSVTLTALFLAGISGNWSGSYVVIPCLGMVRIQQSAGITPVADGTVTPLTSGTTKSGIVTALS